MNHPTTEELKETIRLADAATPGPWAVSNETGIPRVVASQFQEEGWAYSGEICVFYMNPDGSVWNKEHVAHNHPARAKSMALEILRLREALEVIADERVMVMSNSTGLLIDAGPTESALIAIQALGLREGERHE